MITLNDRSRIKYTYLATHILLLPLLLLLSVFLIDERFLLLGIAQISLLILLFTGYWEFQGIRFKRFYCIAVELLIVALFVSSLKSAHENSLHLFWQFFFASLQLYLFYLFAKIILTIFWSDSETVAIAFPLKNGSYLITDGGNSKVSRMMNYHFHSAVHKKKKTRSSMLYATDVVKLNKARSSFFPNRNEDYPIFGEELHAPMEGILLKVINEIPDNNPFSGNYPYNTGNSIVIKNENYFFLLGHLKKGSIVVTEGDFVQKGDFVGNVGNSGFSERPHLHMQLMKSDTDDYWKGTGICIQYRGKNLYKNRLINSNLKINGNDKITGENWLRNLV